MLNRRGLTLIELLISIVVLGILGLATARLMRVLLNTSSAQVAIAANQGGIRTASIALPQEFREIGYDTIPLAGLATSDLESIGSRRITFRAMRGFSTTCGTPTLLEFRVRKPVAGLRPPVGTDGVLLYVENDPNFGLDDQWVALNVASIDYNSTCGADSAIAFTLATAPIVDPFSSTAMALSQYFVGGPVRWFERMEYGPVVDPVTNLGWVGVRSLSLGETTLSPVIGPLPDTVSYSFEYRSSSGAPVAPGTGNPLLVRTIGLNLTGVTSRSVSLAGSTTRAASRMRVTTSVALRNTLRP